MGEPPGPAISGTVRQELSGIEQAVEAIAEVRRRMTASPDDRVFVDAAAMRLHAFYGGVERCLKRLLTELREEVPSGDKWHRQLLDQVSREVPTSRPAILSSEAVAMLDRFRTFRHLFRNLYGFQLDREQLAPLLAEADAAWARFSTEVQVFATALASAKPA